MFAIMTRYRCWYCSDPTPRYETIWMRHRKGNDNDYHPYCVKCAASLTGHTEAEVKAHVGMVDQTELERQPVSEITQEYARF